MRWGMPMTEILGIILIVLLTVAILAVVRYWLAEVNQYRAHKNGNLQIQSDKMEGNMQRLKDGEHIFIVFGKDGKSVLDSQRRIRIYQSKENFEKFCPEPYNEVELVEYAPVQSHEEE